MTRFETKLFESAFELKRQIGKAEKSLAHTTELGIRSQERSLIDAQVHAMEIYYHCLVQRIALRNLTKEYSEYCIERFDKPPLPF